MVSQVEFLHAQNCSVRLPCTQFCSSRRSRCTQGPLWQAGYLVGASCRPEETRTTADQKLSERGAYAKQRSNLENIPPSSSSHLSIPSAATLRRSSPNSLSAPPSPLLCMRTPSLAPPEIIISDASSPKVNGTALGLSYSLDADRPSKRRLLTVDLTIPFYRLQKRHFKAAKNALGSRLHVFS